MFSKLLVCFALATAVNGQSACLEDGHPDNDCCALAGHMSCSGGNKLKPSTTVCWTGSYGGQTYTAYNYACYPTESPDGHDPSKCMEDGHQDDDCCAIKGHESCSSGFRVQGSNHACFKNAQFTAYSYFCTPSSGATSNNDAACTPSRCTSPGPNGNHDCWAGNGEPFTCSGDFSPKKTGKTAPYGGQTWSEYTCCPGALRGCSDQYCNSPNGQGGYDCWAGNGEPFTCKNGYTAKMTGQTAPYDDKTWKEYKCCPAPTQCTPSKCTSPNGQGGHDCWAGNGEPFTCAAGYTSKMTDRVAPSGGKQWHEYTCCKVGGSANSGGMVVSDNSQCDASACREYTKDKADNDCCGVIGQIFCGDGFNLRYKKNDQSCEKWSPQHRGTCCVKNGQHHSQNFKHDKSKCRSHGEADGNCCAFQGGAECADGYKVTQSKTDVCFKYQQYTAYKYTCTPGGSMSGLESDPKQCREHGRFDNDCCAVKGTNTCAGATQLEQTDKVCFRSQAFTAYTYNCLVPDTVVVHG